MKRERIFCALLAAAAVGGTALALGGSADDPLISLSYLANDFRTSLVNTAGQRVDAANQQAYDTVAAQSGTSFSVLTEVDLSCGDSLSCTPGSTLLHQDGSISLSTGVLIDATEGVELTAGAALPAGHRLIVSEAGSAAVTVVSDTAVILAEGGISTTVSSGPDYYAIADALNRLGMFSGQGTGLGRGYALESCPTRAESVVMFLRLIGEQQTAVLYPTDAMPFTDVPDWAAHYVAYAYAKGYTYGVGDGRFGSNEPVSANQYATFVLRALGYSDTSIVPDFTWDTALRSAAGFGLLTERESAYLSNTVFRRSHMAYLSWYALSAREVGRSTTLADRLISTGILTTGDYSAAKALVTRNRL